MTLPCPLHASHQKENLALVVAKTSAAGGARNLSDAVAEEPMGSLFGSSDAIAAEKDSSPKVRMSGKEVCGADNKRVASVVGVRVTLMWAATDIVFCA